MKCADCSERLSDFLLDELPEREAVLVQEHLAHCAECMATYKELKGTGRALEAVPALRPVKASAQFGEQVRTGARVEARKIIERLPPEKRLRMEMRQARMAQVRGPSSVSQRKSASPWSGPVLTILALGGAAAAAILLYPGKPAEVTPRALGALSLSLGKVDQFYQKAGEHWTPVGEGKPFATDDEFATGEDGAARFELAAGGCVLLGPGSEIKFRRGAAPGPEWILQLTRGEAGVERPAAPPGAQEPEKDWLIRTDAATVAAAPGVHVFVRAVKDAQGPQADVLAARGQATVSYWHGERSETLQAGEESSFWLDTRNPLKGNAPEAWVPPWRADLLRPQEVARLISENAKVLERRPAGLLVEFSWGFGKAGALGDWKNEEGKHLGAAPNGALQVPADAQFSLPMDLGLPLTSEFAVAPETPRETAFAFVVLDTPNGRVSVDLEREAILQVREKNRPRAARVPYRADPKVLERVRLELARVGQETQALLATTGGKTQALPLPKSWTAPGGVLFNSLGEGLVLEGIKITGLVPRDWLRKRMAE